MTIGSEKIRRRELGVSLSRRRFLAGSSCIAAGLILPPSFTKAAVTPERRLSFHHTHTGEKLKVTYWADGVYVEDGLREVNLLLRDHRTGDAHTIDPELLNLLHRLQLQLDSNKPFHIISGYRSPKTNNMLRSRSGGVAKRSLHMDGKAIDIRLPGRDLRQLHRAAKAEKAGGVGLYAGSDFIHVDTGRVRYW
ncbi:MAG: DUF882 domain-containing protein [Sedimenticola sp.]